MATTAVVRFQKQWRRSRRHGPAIELAGVVAKADGVAEAERLDAERALARGPSASTRVQPRDEGPLAAIVRNTTTRTRLGARVLMIWEVAVEDGCGRSVCSRAIATAVSLTRLPRARSDARWIDSLVGLVTADVLAQIEAASAPWRTGRSRPFDRLSRPRVAREHAVAAALEGGPPTTFQPGMFDRRGHHAQAAARAAHEHTANAIAKRLAMLERRAVLSILPPALRLVLVP